jgi:hypothetical protein
MVDQNFEMQSEAIRGKGKRLVRIWPMTLPVGHVDGSLDPKFHPTHITQNQPLSLSRSYVHGL